MIIDKNLVQEYFEIKDLPEWRCPECNSGILSTRENGLIINEYPSSLKQHNNETWEPEMIAGNFLGLLNCSNSKCNCKVVFAGDMFVERTKGEEIDEPPYFQSGYSEIIAPKYFNPPLQIIPITKKLPKTVSKALFESFKVFWTDNASCANKIRITVEEIMDDQKIPKTHFNKQKTKRINYKLHERILLFQKKNSEVGELLLAVKWIGNEGSHELNTLSRKDMIVAFEILEQCLDKIYNTIPKEIMKMARKINRSKGIKRKAH